MPTETTLTVIRLEHRFLVPAEQVFRAWTEPRALERWAWGSLGHDVHASVDLRVGGTFMISMRRPDGERWAFSGNYTEIEPNRRLAHTLHWDAPMGYDAAAETVSVDFEEHEGETMVVFRHSGDLGLAALEGHREGWQDVLAALERHLEDERERSTPGT